MTGLVKVDGAIFNHWLNIAPSTMSDTQACLVALNRLAYHSVADIHYPHHHIKLTNFFIHSFIPPLRFRVSSLAWLKEVTNLAVATLAWNSAKAATVYALAFTILAKILFAKRPMLCAVVLLWRLKGTTLHWTSNTQIAVFLLNQRLHLFEYRTLQSGISMYYHFQHGWQQLLWKNKINDIMETASSLSQLTN